MPALTLAVEIADAVAAAKKRRRASFDVKSKAEELARTHSNAGASVGDVTDTLEEESLAAGIIPISEPGH
ncbi:MULTISPECIES: hypothetical protein [unclassified Mesorhizobium]|uniref:hypothetical protein n=1 Tax=unclassified Mesorhizobium TaxID=325217 RepID=UPI0011292479|nr:MULTISPECIES: hypothetical protein [unclassified Mesorhizobium]TPI57450.1 hypothetical protein FJ417_22025 [Mesorhizobium sp. B3-1-7]UCI28101.1 hypothetical protein FJ430_11075 [Mesorhizobium sp. B2-8-5]